MARLRGSTGWAISSEERTRQAVYGRASVTMRAKPAWRRAYCVSVAALIGFLFCVSCVCHAAEPNPLRPVDTSSPRATLQGFIEATDIVYARMTDVLGEYGRSDRLYLTSEEHQKQLETLRNAQSIIRYLDVSEISPVLRETIAAERVLQLKEILDRIALPTFADIPDREAMVRVSSKRWRLPDTEIEIVLMQDGPRAGEYLVSTETVDRLPEFYQRVRSLPYKPGAAKQLSDLYRTVSSGNAATIYEAYLSSPVGLSYIVPPRWMLSLPDWAKVGVFGVTAWQWLGLGSGLVVGALVMVGGYRLARRLDDGDEDAAGPRWRAVPVPLAIILVAAFLVPVSNALLRVGGSPRVVITYAQTGAVYVSAAWLAIVASIIVGEVIVASEHLTARSLDSQLIRLGTRLVGIVAATAILIRGADELGFPAYSVLAGLGVGGLAVALAARDTIANLIGSLLITMEKPFRVGHFIRVGGSEGTVENVGFRSTRIRTADNSLVSIPSSAVVNTTVENLSLRMMRRQRFFVQVTYGTSREKVEELVAGIKRLLVDRPLVDKNTFQVRFNNFAESSLDILVMFHLRVEDYGTELSEREAVLLQIMELVKDAGVEFAFPTRTLYVENSLPSVKPAHADMAHWSVS
jgi:MscS family membrane protein